MKNNIVYKYRKDTLLPIGYMEKLEQKRYSNNTINIYTHVSKKAIDKIRNPIDDFFK